MPRSSEIIMPSTYQQQPVVLQYEEFTSPPEFVPGLDSFELEAFDTEVKLEPYDYNHSSPESVPNSTAKGKPKSKASGAAKSRQANSSASASAASPETAESEKVQKAADRRAEQNRQAQKTFRENRKKHIKELEDKLGQANHDSMTADLLRQENNDLRNVILSLQSENDKLKKEKAQLNFVWNPEGVIPSFEAMAPANGGSPPALVPQKESPPNDGFSSTTVTSASSPASTAPLSSPPSSTSTFNTPSPDAVPFSPTLSFLDYSSAASSSFPVGYFQQPQFLQLQEPIGEFNGMDPALNPPQGIDWDIDTLLVPVDSVSDDQLVLPSSTVPVSQEHHEKVKRTLSEASFYNNTPLPFRPATLSKDPDASRDRVETEICDLFKKIHCKDKNPELAHGTKFIKKAM